jgi:arginase family enzyme
MCTFNTADELLKIMRLGCYTIVLNGSVLEVSPAYSIDKEMAELIIKHKAELIEILKNEGV